MDDRKAGFVDPGSVKAESVINAPTIEMMLRTQRVIVAIGAGGVGKTTSSIALAIQAARLGRRVALLSIDPAKRLAAALGIELGHELRPVNFPHTAGINGTLSAAMLDQKAVFDGMVRKHAPSPHIADRILRDPLYIAASTNLSGPLEYMALARLQELAESADYDLVVLDTPPDSHALDFLGRPNVLSGFIENKVVSRLIKPVVMAGRAGLGRVMTISERVLGGITSVTGFSALSRFGEFVLLMQEVIDGFHRAGERVLQILRKDSTSFVLVAAPNRASSRSASALCNELKKLGYGLDGVIFNRCLPKDIASIVKADPSDTVAVLKSRLRSEDAVVAELKAKITTTQRAGEVWHVRIDDQPGDIHSLEGILSFSEIYSGL